MFETRSDTLMPQNCCTVTFCVNHGKEKYMKVILDSGVTISTGRFSRVLYPALTDLYKNYEKYISSSHSFRMFIMPLDAKRKGRFFK